MGSTIELSVIIPTYNKSSRLLCTLSALQAQSYPNFEVIICDDGSTDTTKETVNRFTHKLHLTYLHQKNQGRATARNHAARHARSSFLVFIDDDIMTERDFISQHLTHKEAHPNHIICGKLFELIGFVKSEKPYSKDNQHKHIDLDEVKRHGFRCHDHRIYQSKLERLAEIIVNNTLLKSHYPWLTVVGSNMSMSVSTWQAISGFDEHFGLKWGCEDLEFSFRAFSRGIQILREPSLKRYHLSHFEENRRVEHTHNLKYFLATHPQLYHLDLESFFSGCDSITQFASRLLKLTPQP